MRAVWLRQFGGPDVLTLEETIDPVAGAGQVLVDATFANITFIDTRIRAGAAPFPVQLPMILGNGVGGVIAAVGPGVPGSRIGTRIVSVTGGSGGYASVAVVDAADAVPVSPAIDLATATALLADGRTALLMLRAAEIGAGDRVLVEAAAGGVGTLLVQLAATAGAHVIAAAGGRRKLELARTLGATDAVDYRRDGWTDEVRDAVGAVHVVLDGVGGAVAEAAFAVLADGGRMLTFGAAAGAWPNLADAEVTRRGITVLRPPRPSVADMRHLTAEALRRAADGDLRPIIGQVHPLADVAAAHAAIEARTTVGKTLLDATA
jgi:NADPH2:quinone reductase